MKWHEIRVGDIYNKDGDLKWEVIDKYCASAELPPLIKLQTYDGEGNLHVIYIEANHMLFNIAWRKGVGEKADAGVDTQAPPEKPVGQGDGYFFQTMRAHETENSFVGVYQHYEVVALAMKDKFKPDRREWFVVIWDIKTQEMVHKTIYSSGVDNITLTHVVNTAIKTMVEKLAKDDDAEANK